ncbi:hypothetical protein CR513_29931, partial [Mucuna pruriens]
MKKKESKSETKRRKEIRKETIREKSKSVKRKEHKKLAIGRCTSRVGTCERYKALHGLDTWSLPNGATYKTNLGETKEIKKQLAKLIETGWVRETISPCAMLVILVPKSCTWKGGDLVWVHLRKERFPHLRKSKLLLRGNNPFKIITKIDDDAYRVEMP